MPPPGTKGTTLSGIRESANTLCQDLICPICKTGSLQASPAVVQGMAYATGMQGQPIQISLLKRPMGEGSHSNIILPGGIRIGF